MQQGLQTRPQIARDPAFGAILTAPQRRALCRIGEKYPVPTVVSSSATNRHPVQPSTANSASWPWQCLHSHVRNVLRGACWV